MTANATAFIERLETLARATEGPAKAPIAMLVTATRCRVGQGVDALAALPAPERLHVLKLLVSARAPTPELAAITRSTILDADGHFLRAEPEMSERMLAVWSGVSPEAAGWGALTQLDRIVCITRLVAAGYPPADALDTFIGSLLTETDRESAVVAWCRERPFGASEPEVAHLLGVERPMARLEAMASLLARGEASRELAREWIGAAEAAWKDAPRDNLGRALVDARFAAVLSAAGDLPSAEGLLGHALAGAARENETKERARIYRVCLEAAAGLALRSPHGGTAAEPWLRAVEKVMNDKVLLRDREAFLEARAAAVRTLARASLTGGDATVDRGHQLLKELCRRVPERWLDLLHAATVLHLQAKSGRSTEVLLASIADGIRKDGLARPIPNITLDEVMRELAPAAPDRVLKMGDTIAHPVQRAIWWSSAAPFV